jgi:molybdopterin synthase catalytic subunit
MSISVQLEDFDIKAETEKVTAGRTDIGALVTFTGLARDHAGTKTVEAMELEHYPGMTERELERIEKEAHDRWQLQASRIIHRYGPLHPGEQIVLVITASAHRKDAFEAAEFLMDWLKTKAPFWKKETGPSGTHWVDAKASDDEAAARWQK